MRVLPPLTGAALVLTLSVALAACGKTETAKPPAPSPKTAPTPDPSADPQQPSPPPTEGVSPSAEPQSSEAQNPLPNLDQGGLLVVAGITPAEGPLSILGDVALLSLTAKGYVVRGAEELAAAGAPPDCDSGPCWVDLGKAVGTAYVLVLNANTEPSTVTGALYDTTSGASLAGGGTPYGAGSKTEDPWDALRNLMSGLLGDAHLRPRGTLPQEALTPVEQAVKGRLRGCYHDALKANPKRADLAVTFAVSPQGRVGRIVIHRTTHPSPEAEQCLRRVLQNAAFPHAEGGDEIIHWALTFPPPDAS